MKLKSDLAKGWVQKGDSDLAAARRTVASDGPYDTACFHTQQASEKYLKAVMAAFGLDIPRTHDLEELQILCLEVVLNADFKALELEELSDYAVSVRYDFEFWPDIKTATDAVNIAEHVRLFAMKAIAPYL